MNHPRLGERVFYTLNEGDADEINGSRAGSSQRKGNPVSSGEQFPAVLVKNYGGPVWNLQVALDGNDSHWAMSREAGDGPGKWQTRVSL